MVNKPIKSSIVIAQTREDDLEEIRRSRDPMSNNRVIYITNPGDVLFEAARNTVDLVITGQCFYLTDLDNARAILLALKEEAQGIRPIIDHFEEPFSGPSSGTELSEQIYQINPKILVLRYSLTPYERGKIAGEINKYRGPTDLVELIDAEDLSDILTSRNWKDLRQRFPRIKFYHQLEQERPTF